MPRKSKSTKKRFYGVNTNELALVFSIAITLFVAGVMTGGVKFTTNSKAYTRPVDGLVRVCGSCAPVGDASREAPTKCQPGMYCQAYSNGGQTVAQCICLDKNKDGTFVNKDCQTLASGGTVALPGATGVPSTNSCWKCQKSDFKIKGSRCP